jgi:hypothetical protein
MVVTTTGMATEVGRILERLSAIEEEKTTASLQR